MSSVISEEALFNTSATARRSLQKDWIPNTFASSICFVSLFRMLSLSAIERLYLSIRSAFCAFNNSCSSINLRSDSDIAGSSSVASAVSALSLFSVDSVENLCTASDRGVNTMRLQTLAADCAKFWPDTEQHGSVRATAGFVKSILCDARGDGAVESRLNEVGLRLRAHEDNRDRHVDEAEAISLKPLLRCD